MSAMGRKRTFGSSDRGWRIEVQAPFLPGVRYLAEGGQETELMYGYGFDLPEFALFPLLDNPAAVNRLTIMYRAVLDVAVRHGMGVVLGGLDYRASPDWAGRLRLSAAALAASTTAVIDIDVFGPDGKLVAVGRGTYSPIAC